MAQDLSDVKSYTNKISALARLLKEKPLGLLEIGQKLTEIDMLAGLVNDIVQKEINRAGVMTDIAISKHSSVEWSGA